MNKLFPIVLALLFFSRISASNIEPIPLIKFSYDKNLGWTYGFGVSVVNFKEGVGEGIYTLISYSKEKKGRNISFGIYSGVGLASFRIGVNRMAIIEKDISKVFWGIEVSPTFLLLHLNAGMMTDGKILDKSKYRLNLSGGAGLF